MNENKDRTDKMANPQAPQQSPLPKDREPQGQQKGAQQIPSPQRDVDVTRK